MVEELEKQDTNEEVEKEEAVKEFENWLEQEGLKDKYPNLVYKYMSNNKVFALDVEGDGNVDQYHKENGEGYISIFGYREEMKDKGLYETCLKLAGYEEKKENGVYKMYKLDGEEKEQIEQFSEEYLEAWKDIMFYAVYLWFEDLDKEEFRKYVLDVVDMTKLGKEEFKSLRIKHFEAFKEKGIFNEPMLEEEIQKYTPELIYNQIMDERFNKLGDPVTKEELKHYLDEGYIEENTYERGVELIEERENMKDKEDKEKQEASEVIKEELNWLKSD